jgi:SPP1 gp7 family putative phage head morphogenesis protein
MSSNDYLIDANTRNAVLIQRKAAGDYRDILRYFDELEERLAGVVMAGSFKRYRQQQIVLEAARTAKDVYAKMGADISGKSIEMAEYIAGFEARLLSIATTASIVTPDNADVAKRVLNAVMNTEPGVSSLTVKQAIQAYGSKKAQEVTAVISDSLLSGRAPQETLKAVSESLIINKRQAEALVRTTANASAQVGRLATFVANDDVLDGYEWVAKLDNRTTLVCAGRDGKIWPIGAGPIPPAHWNCRSQIVAAVSPEYNRLDLSGERNSQTGEITAETTYGQWLKRQPAKFQDEALGRDRGALFRRGDLAIDKFTDTTGKTYTLSQLKDLEPLAFEKAGL